MSDLQVSYEDFAKIDGEMKIMLSKVSSLQRHDFMNRIDASDVGPLALSQQAVMDS